MKSMKITFLIPLLLLYFPFIALSENSKSGSPQPMSCHINMPNSIIMEDISTDDFGDPTYYFYGGRLADERYTKNVTLSFSNCSVSNSSITLYIDNENINSNNGYLINHATGPTASENVTFRLISPEDPQHYYLLHEKNVFCRTIDKDGQASFHFDVNYVKIDGGRPKPGNVIAHIAFTVILEDTNILIVD
ncbi:fimbrial protein [Escherichia coli]|nr:fimbrial protein [Escherichia coli]